MCENHLGFYSFIKLSGSREPSWVSIFFQGKNLVLKLGSSQQFENNRFSWLVLTSPISKFSFVLELQKN
jgi:hypothetical protein